MKQDNRGLFVVFGILVLALVFGPLLMGGMMGAGFVGPGMMGWGFTPGAVGTSSGWAWGLGMAAGGLMMLVFWGALILGIVLLVRWALGQGATGTRWSDADEPLTILRRRYAAGEIDLPTYERMKAELGDNSKQPQDSYTQVGASR